MDGWDFKQYVLGTLFYRYISEKLTDYLNAEEREAGDTEFDYAALPDDEAMAEKDNIVQILGFFIPPSELFQNVLARAETNESLNETLEQVFRHIESSATGTPSQDDLTGLFDEFDVNSSKLGATVKERNAKLTKLLSGVGAMRLGHYQDNTIDAFGDAYEYLMRMYASNAGKSGGEYYTPQEVSELLTRLTVIGKTQVNKVYDPACGSGSLLLKFAKVIGRENVRNGFYGQDENITATTSAASTCSCTISISTTSTLRMGTHSSTPTTGTMSRSRRSYPTRRTPKNGRGRTTLCSSMTRAMHLRASSPRRASRTSPLSCTPLRGSRRAARRRLSASRASCIAAAQRRKSVSTSWTATTSMP